MAPTALAYTYCVQADVEAVLSVAGVVGRVDDNDDGAMDADDEEAFLTKAISWATAKVNLFCLPLYPAADLATDWLVNNWCSILAAYQLCGRRGNPIPSSLKEMYEAALEDMKLVRTGTYQLDLGLRDVAWPAWSNVRVEIGYALRRIRVERPISERTPTPYAQNRDLAAEFIWEPR